MTISRPIIFLFALTLMVGCRSYVLESDDDDVDQPKEITVKLDESFVLGPGDQAVLEEDGFRIRFNRVSLESRCPWKVTCVQAGAASVNFNSESPEGWISSVTLTVPGLAPVPYTNNFIVQHANHRLKLLSLTPYPVEGEPINSDDYRAHLVLLN